MNGKQVIRLCANLQRLLSIVQPRRTTSTLYTNHHQGNCSVLVSTDSINLSRPFTTWLTNQEAFTNSHLCQNNRSILYNQIRKKGHSHWQNIKATKGAKDAARSRETQLLVMRIKGAIRGWYFLYKDTG